MTMIDVVGSTSHGNAINRYVFQRMIKGPSKEEERTEQVYRRRIKYFAWVVGLIGQVPFARIAGEIAGSNYAYKIALIYGNIGAFSAFYAWSTSNAMEDMLMPYTNEEKLLLVDRLPLLLKVSLVGVGALAQTPPAYASYLGNDRNLVYPIVVYLCHPGPTVYSLVLTAKRFMRMQVLNESERKIQRLRDVFIQALEQSHQALIHSNTTVWSNVLGDLMQISSNTDLNSDQAVEQYFKKLLKLKPSSIPQNHKGSKISGVFVGSVLTLSQFWLYYNVGMFLGADFEHKSKPDDSGLQIFLGSLMVACNAYLLAKGIIGSTFGAFSKISSLVKGNRQASYAHALSAPLNMGLTLIGLGTIALSYGANVVFARTYFDQEWQTQTQEVLLPMGVIFLVLNALEAMVDDVVESSITKTDNVKEIIRLHREHKRFIHLLSRSPLVEFAKFSGSLPNDLMDQYLQRAKVTSDQISEYIHTKYTLDGADVPLLT